MSNGLCKTTLCLLVLLAGCAGELEQPERFLFLGTDGGVLTGGGTGGGGGGGAGGTGGNVPEAPACVTAFFDASCGQSVCHGAGAQMDLVSPGVAARLVDKPSAEDLLCKGRTLVSSTGGESLLLQKLTDFDCGMQMPFGGMATEEEIACVRDWIEGMSAGGGTDGGQ